MLYHIMGYYSLIQYRPKATFKLNENSWSQEPQYSEVHAVYISLQKFQFSFLIVPVEEQKTLDVNWFHKS